MLWNRVVERWRLSWWDVGVLRSLHDGQSGSGASVERVGVVL